MCGKVEQFVVVVTVTVIVNASFYRYVERYADGVKKLAPTKDKHKWRAACIQADSALKLSNLERSKLIVDYADDSASDMECEDVEETEGLNLPCVCVVIVYI
jgi:hypothetical protein